MLNRACESLEPCGHNIENTGVHKHIKNTGVHCQEVRKMPLLALTTSMVNGANKQKLSRLCDLIDRAHRSGRMTAANAMQGTGAPQGSNTAKATSNTNRQRLPHCLNHPSALPEMNCIPQSQMDILVPGSQHVCLWGKESSGLAH